MLLVQQTGFSQAALPESGKQSVRVRFIDSATGYAVQPASIVGTPHEAGKPGTRMEGSALRRGRGEMPLDAGRYTISVNSPAYKPMSGEFEMTADNPYRIEFHLDPVVEPAEIQPARVATLHRDGETIFLGYVADDESGGPLENVLVRSEPSGAQTRTDARGYFEIYVPVQTLAEAKTSPARLIFSRAGHKTEERQFLELWSRGDWIYRVRLEPGAGEKIVDERQFRRRTHYPLHVRGEENSSSDAAGSNTTERESDFSGKPTGVGARSVKNSGPPPIRIPTNIRVLRQDAVTVDYVSLQTYCQRSLPSEWIASWGSTGPGNSGTNSLLAGAVAIRTYAIGFINNPANSAYDICGTTSCQVYNHTASDSRTTAAANATANYAMIQSGATRIGFKITEYSAENNSLGFSCGDGFTQPAGGCIFDPVCTGEARFGHGRGICQWGTARWASGRRMQNRVTSDSVTNGYPLQNWVWLCEHYYPNLQLVQGSPLVIGDFVQVAGAANLTVRECAGGSITNGTGCPQVATKASGSTGVIIAGPTRVTTDGIGYTWWRVQWHDAGPTIGWVPENWLERIAEPPNVSPVLAPIANMTVTEGLLLTFTNSATASADASSAVTDFESFASGTASGTVLLRQPNFSGSTSGFLDASPNTTSVTDAFPAGNGGSRVLRANWSWNSSANPWLRLTTSGTASVPNPVIALTRKLRFDIFTSRSLNVGIGIRETGNAAGTPIGSNGGTTPAIIEWAGVTNSAGGQPQTTRTVTASNWTTLVFDLPNEPIRSFSGGNGVLSTATGLGVLEHLAFVPAAGVGTYEAFLDNFIVTTPMALTYSLSNAPPGAVIDPATGVFSWTPTEAQGPGIYNITVKVTDNNLPPLSDSKSFQVTVAETNAAPALAAITNRAVHAGTLVTFTNFASDSDIPANTLTFSLDPGAPSGASMGAANGIFSWLTTDVGIGTSNYITARVTDNGVPSQNDTKSFAILVLARPAIQSASVSGANFILTWSAIPGTKYRVQFKNNLGDPAWTTLVPDVTAVGTTASYFDPVNTVQRFYRVSVLDL